MVAIAPITEYVMVMANGILNTNKLIRQPQNKTHSS